MVLVLAVSVVFGFVGVAHGVGEHLVKCDAPVDLRFIANPGQMKPEFSEEVAPGQKHWWSYGCKLDAKEAGSYSVRSDDRSDSVEAVRSAPSRAIAAWRLLTSANTTVSCTPGSENCTATTTTTTTTTTTVTDAVVNTTTAAVGTTVTDAVVNTTTTEGVSEGEVSACISTGWNTLAAGISLSLPLVMADDAEFKKRDHVVDVLLPCDSLMYPLKDLDGDGQLDCTMTKEQSEIGTVIPALAGSWKVAAAHTVAHGRRLVEHKHLGDNMTFDAGAMCMDTSDVKDAFKHSGEHVEFLQRALPTAVANVGSFNHKGERCEGAACEASMWTFDLTYPASACLPNLPGWVRPCSAKMMPNGQLVLIRGEITTAGSVAQRPPLMEDIEVVHDILPFANGLAAAAQSQFDITILQKKSQGSHKAFVEADVDANGALSFSEFEAALSKLPEQCASAF